MAWLLWPDGSLCDGFEGLAARHPSAALKDVAPGGCASVNGAPVSQVWNDEAGVRVAVEGSPGVPLAADVLIGADGIHSGVRAQVFGPKAEYFHYLGMRAAAFIATEPLLNERFRNKFVLTDTIDRMAGVYSLRPNHVAALMVYRDAAGERGMAIAGAALLGEVHGPVASTKGIGPALTEFERCWRPVVEDAQAAGRRAASSFLPKNHVQRFLRLDHQGNPCAGNRPCRGTPHRWQNRKVSIEGSGLPEGRNYCVFRIGEPGRKLQRRHGAGD